MAELVDYDPEIPLGRLFLAGINVGSEVLGSMINTLILAYIGSSLPMAVLISSAGVNYIGLMNDPYVAQELAQSLAGTVGLLLTEERYRINEVGESGAITALRTPVESESNLTALEDPSKEKTTTASEGTAARAAGVLPFGDDSSPDSGFLSENKLSISQIVTAARIERAETAAIIVFLFIQLAFEW